MMHVSYLSKSAAGLRNQGKGRKLQLMVLALMLRNGEMSFDISDILDQMGLKQYMEIFCEDLLGRS